MNQKRQPKGIETGGQFAASVNPESTLVLDDADPYCMGYHVAGNVSNVQEGSRSPWGTIDHVDHIAPGIVIVGTPGHGGVKLSPERNKKIPSALRNSSGWYEEDCESYIPMMIHAGDMKRPSESAEDARKRAEQGVIDWFPEGYEDAFSVELPVGVSRMKDEKTWLTTHAYDEIAISASSADNGMVRVTVCTGGRANYGRGVVKEREILVPKDDYDNPEFRYPIGKHSGSFVVDATKKHYTDVTPPPKAPNPPAPRYRGIDTSGLSDSARQRAARDLSKRYSFGDGTVQSVHQVIENGGIAGKSSMENNGRRKYYLRRAQEAEGQPATDTFSALEVSKALWDSVNAPAS
jgi:hypothetical protein